MKILESYGVQEMNAKEIREINGGGFLISFILMMASESYKRRLIADFKGGSNLYYSL